jgi:hypothetical protein
MYNGSVGQAAVTEYKEITMMKTLAELAVTLEEVKVRGGARLWLVMQNGKVVGQLEKYPDTRADSHPWKAFSGTGAGRIYLGAFYPACRGRKASETARRLAVDRILEG